MLSKNSISFFKSLHQKKYRQQRQLFIVEGEKPLAELWKSSDWEVVFWGFRQDFATRYEVELATYGIAYEILTADELHQLTTLEYQQAGIAVVKMSTNEPLKPLPATYTIVLDNIQDPGNLGTVLRLADWYGFSQLVCSMNCVEVYNPKTIGASMGSFLRVKTFYTDLPAYLEQYKELPVLGALMEGENLHKAVLPTAGFLVLGNEGHGISAEVMPYLQKPLTIPRFGQAESLNVAMATAVFLDRLAQIVHNPS